jgi:hypothetical protein
MSPLDPLSSDSGTTASPVCPGYRSSFIPRVTSALQMRLPDLPLDVFYVIACHLAGMFAFGTLANLHVASHNVAEIVLPVLYETILLDNVKEPPIKTVDDGKQTPEALLREKEIARYVKCVGCDDAYAIGRCKGPAPV